MTNHAVFRRDLDDLYKIWPGGGPLHIVTDDTNVETDHIVWCLINADRWHAEYGDGAPWDYTERETVQRICAYLLDIPSEAGRERALDEWWSNR